jgi:Flp pilus assembly protein TadG
MQSLFDQSSRGGASLMLTVGATLVGISASVLAVDLPYYFATQNQLQTTVDAAALAGASALPVGEQEAREAAYELASRNPVAGYTLQPGDLKYTVSGSSFEVSASSKVPTIVAKFLCSFSKKNGSGKKLDDDGLETGGSGGDSTSGGNCSYMTVYAHSKATPAARDTVLVIDTSSSMDDLGNNRPMKDVKSAAKNFVDMVAKLQSESVDRIGLVSFNQTGTLQQGLISQKQSPGFSAVKTKIDNLKLFSGAGWNTNYEAGLKIALNELESNGRKNADKIVIFLTDGKPNLPAPSSYYNYNRSEPYTKCTDLVHNSSAVKAQCYKSGGRTICPTLPSSAITDSMIPSSAVSCGTTYVDFMQSATNAQTDRAKAMNVTIHTIAIHDYNDADNAQAVLRRLIKDPYWQPSQLEYMAMATKGQQYDAANYDAARINQIYAQVAQDIHIKLSN